MDTQQITNEKKVFDVGEYFGSQRGIFQGEAVIALAVQNGFKVLPISVDDMKAAGPYHMGLWDDAENFMNNTYPKDGYFWGNNENGDWGLWPLEDDDD